jgi:hypothetical protein
MCSFEEAEERNILAIMRSWPARMEARLQAAGYENFAGGDHVLQEHFEHKLINPDDPDTLACIKWLAEQGHRSAKEALRKYATAMLENTQGNLSSSVRSYLINILNGRVSPHPEDTRTDVIRNMLRDAGIAMMVEVAEARWGLPKLNSGRRHSAGWFVGRVMTGHTGVELGERHVRHIIQSYRKGIGKRLADFLLAGAVE